MSLIVSSFVGGVNDHNVCADDSTAERAIIASDEVIDDFMKFTFITCNRSCRKVMFSQVSVNFVYSG